MNRTFFKFCLLACIALFGVACSNSVKLTGNEFLIKGKISGLEDGVVIELYNIGNDTIRNGRFTIRGEAKQDPERQVIRIMEDGPAAMPLVVWIAQGAKIKIKGKGHLSPLWKVKSSVPYQKEENRYTNEYRDIRAECVRIGLEHLDLVRKSRSASSEDEVFTYHKALDSLQAIFNPLNVNRIIKENYANISIMEKTNIFSSPVWLGKMHELVSLISRVSAGRFYISAEQAEYFSEKAWELYGRMSEEDRNTELGIRITATLFPSSRTVVDVGDNFADSDLLDINGHTKRLADYSGKYLLLDFWHSGCGPCIKAFPEIKEISGTYRDKLTVISISFDSDASWKKTIAKHDMPWVNLRDPKSSNGLSANYSVTGTPTYIMISPEGKIIDKWWGDEKTSLKSKVGENIN